MNEAQVLNIAIVICGVYAGLSCLCSWVNERIAAFLALRGWNLFRGIANLLGTDQLAATVFNHPLVAANSPKPNQLVDASGATVAQRFLSVAMSRPPSYLDARNFSSALWQVLPSLVPSPATPPENVEPDTSGAQTQAAAIAVITAPQSAVATLEATVGKLGPEHKKLRQQLETLLAQASDDYSKLLAATDAWFNAEMDRVTGWYARQTQWIIIVIGFFVVSFAGVDTLEMVRTLSVAKPGDLSLISDSTVARACILYNKCPPSVTTSASTSSPGPLTNGPTNGEPFDVTQFAHVRMDLGNWLLVSQSKNGLRYPRWQGMVLTWLALALGGPFWFNLLCSIANMRSAGTKPIGASHSSAGGSG
ncbi:MAG: hypothetical protein ACLQHL_07940 [Candidatus Cybelea sp.]